MRQQEISTTKCKDRLLVLGDYSWLDFDDLLAIDQVHVNWRKKKKKTYYLKYNAS